MTTYNTYQEAKIANPESDIYVTRISNGGRDDVFGLHDDIEEFTSNYQEANPADYCMTYNQCEEFKSGMVVMDLSGIAEINSDAAEFLNSVKRSGKIKPNWDKCFILRAVALENIPTETPEEKEVLDSIDSAGEVEWKSGDLLEFMGEPCVFVSMLNGFPVVKYTEDADRSLAGCFDEIIAVDRLKKPETPQQRKDRERLEAVKEMFSYWSDDEIDFNSGDEDDRWVKELLFSLYSAGYRKVEL